MEALPSSKVALGVNVPQQGVGRERVEECLGGRLLCPRPRMAAGDQGLRSDG